MGEPSPRGAEPESVARNTLFSLVSQLAASAITAGLTIFLARVLGPEEFGVFALALGVAGLLLLPSDFGVSQSAARFAAEHRGEPERIAEVMASALRLKIYFATVMCVGLVLAAGPIAGAYDEPSLAWPLRAMAVVLLGQNLMSLYGGVLVALGRTPETFRLIMLKSVVEAVSSVILVLVVAGAAEAALGRALGFSVGGVFALALGARVLGRQAIGIGVKERPSTRRVAAYAGAIFIIDGAYALFQQIDTLLIGAYLTVTAAGIFQAPIRLIAFLHYPAQAIANGVAPRLASATGEPHVEPFERGLRYTIVFQAMLVAPCVVWAGPIIDLLLGPDYAESAEVLRALAPFVFLSGLGTLLSLGVNYIGEARRRVPIAIVTVAVNLAIDILLIPEIGIVAGAIGTDVAYFLYVLGHLWVVRTFISLPLGPLMLSIFRSLLAAGAMAGLLAALGTGEVALPLLVLGLVLGVGVYVAVILLSGEMRAAELRQVSTRFVGLVTGRSR